MIIEADDCLGNSGLPRGLGKIDEALPDTLGPPMPLDRPILVTGTPRSGKSVVTALLRRAPEFLFVSEPLMIWDAGLGNSPDNCRSAEEATEEVRRRIVEACERLIEGEGKRRYLDDLAYHALRVPFVHRVMPQAKIIHVIRNPAHAIPEMLYGWTYKDSVSKAFARRRKGVKFATLPRLALRFAKNYVVSRVRARRATWGPRVPGLVQFARSHSIAEVPAYQWLKTVQIARDDLERLPQGQTLEVRYDRLLEQPRSEAERIAAFCEVENRRELIEFAAEYLDPDCDLEGKVYPTEAEWSAIRRLIGPLQRRLGYWQ